MFQINTSRHPDKLSAQSNLEILLTQLKNNINVTWLLAGGSAIKVYTEMNDLLDSKMDLTKLNISLGDERYSKDPEHKDATWPIYEKLKLFSELSKRGANIFEILSGQSLEKDAERFDNFLRDRLRQSDFILCNLGMGTDCHTAGIIPLDDKKLFHQVYPENRLAVGHNHGGAHPKRITITPSFIKKANKITVYMTGAEKRPALEKLITFKELEKMQDSIYKYPALITSLMSAEVFTDQKLS